MIEIRKLSKRFGEKEVLKNIDLVVEKGERIAIIGGSGCGKSTLLRLILGLQRPDNGRVLVDEKDVHRISYEALRKLRLKFGTLFQSSALFDSMTVAENVGFSLVENLRLPAGQVSDIVKDKLEWVAMSGYENQMPSQLSGGQRKRVGLARALAADPEIMLYDEPTTGLDPITSTHIEDLIVKLTQTRRVTSVVVSHQISTILRTADKIYMMYEGQLLPPESPATIANSADPRIREFIRGGLS